MVCIRRYLRVYIFSNFLGVVSIVVWGLYFEDWFMDRLEINRRDILMSE